MTKTPNATQAQVLGWLAEGGSTLVRTPGGYAVSDGHNRYRLISSATRDTLITAGWVAHGIITLAGRAQIEQPPAPADAGQGGAGWLSTSR